ncbi:acetylxylan esterase [Xylanimonas allomyrinae]|uniref:Acetylxylan esterase n=1 Tax=Xylanimonas allomyrinae TaxID=2509459 RepID=A0A4P6EPE6_9MICO|nr:acetylxylan esterase [Xylanimonas allomyrinae]QAY64644.1 acetylxylan esterase [Xylanimonas allomyrinae]
MAQYDLPLDELERYSPAVDCPDDLVPFWTATVAEARATADAPVVVRVETGLTEVVVDDVTFAGFGGHPVKAWLVRPARHDPAAHAPLPAVVEMLGYGGGRGLPHEHLRWAAAGVAHLVMDTRGQGGHWGAGGETPDPVGRSAGVAGFMTAGIDDPHDHYYRRFYTDGVRAVDAVRQIPGIDPARVAVTGVSQGGGGSVAVASLLAMAGDDVAAAMPDVPFLSHFRRAVRLVDSRPYGEITQYLSVRRGPAAEATVWRTLSYLDGANLARHATAPALFSVALMDVTCPPSTVYAAYNAWGAAAAAPPRKRIDVYPYNDHEGGQAYRFAPQLAWLRAS